jgi:large subunit ribosomal protein L32
MAVPKFKTSKSKKRKRRTHDKIDAPHLVKCRNCGLATPPHAICDSCGHYPAHGKGARTRAVLTKSEG